MDQNESMKLGQAKNQAVQLTKIIYTDTTNMTMDAYIKVYKDAVRLFCKANNELDNEILNKIPIEEKKPSDKQKYCPKCKIIIPLTWKRHIECGWVE